MQYDVVTYGDPVLRKQARLIEQITDDVLQLAEDMLKTMRAHNGLGLAAHQVGRTESICVIDCSPAIGEDDGLAMGDNLLVPMPLIMVNPRITDMAGEQVSDEGCLSFPEIYTSVKRAMDVTVVFMNLENEEQTISANGLLSRAIQHEVDHLNGVLLVDHMSPVRKIAVGGKLKRLKKKQG
ncbi:MAG: peptide deformylase [Kiritimatiellae bacterium]|nr:peptide deformylase [Kiritimatiellia bacterium]